MTNHILKINNNNKNVQQHIKVFNENKNKGTWFVKYYADWCPHCTNMQSQWNNLENHDIVKNKNINIAEIEESHFSKLSSKPDVIGFPTIKLYVNGNSEDFKESRTTDSMAYFLKNKQVGSSRKSKILKNKRKYKNNTKKNKYVKKGRCSGCNQFGGAKRKIKSIKRKNNKKKNTKRLNKK
jgi:thiol-disulfide isomerase/thioredoxin